MPSLVGPSIIGFLALLILAAKRQRAETIGNAAGGTPFDRAQRAIESMDTAVIKAEARRLRAEGHTDMATALDRAIPIIEKMNAQAKKPKPVWPVTADKVLDVPMDPPHFLGQDDLMVAAWLRAEDNGGPPFVAADLYPDREKRRHLTPRERWVLGPYFPVASDLDTEVYFGMSPDLPPEVVPPANVYAVTMLTEGKTLVTFPHGPQSMLGRWWTSILAHEFAHVSQTRVGMSGEEATGSILQWGYTLSPNEVLARYYQRIVYNDLPARARDYYLARGPIPVFP